MPEEIIILPQYFPSIEYFVYIYNSKKVYFDAYSPYSKQSYRNRCYILTSQKIDILSIPIIHQKSEYTHIKIDYQTNWNKKHWRSIQTSYGRAPYFEHYEDDIKKLLEDPGPLLYDFNIKIFELLIEIVGIDVDIEYIDDKNISNQAIDLRAKLSSPKPSPNKYLPNKASEIYKPKPIESKNDIGDKFAVNFVNYKQIFNPYDNTDQVVFVPNLSILDLLFCKGPHSIDILGPRRKHDVLL